MTAILRTLTRQDRARRWLALIPGILAAATVVGVAAPAGAASVGIGMEGSAGLPVLATAGPEPTMGSGLLVPLALQTAMLTPPRLAASRGVRPAVALGAPGGNVSGLPWPSGASCGGDQFARWRGRDLDENVIFLGHKTWAGLAGNIAKPTFKAAVTLTPQPVVSLPMLPKDKTGQHAACAAGEFDAEVRQIGALLAKGGAGKAIVRLGWEANTGSDTHPWGIDGVAEIRPYVQCFRREVGLLREKVPGIEIEWTNAKRGSLPVSVLLTYPGDDVVDHWGVHYYDSDAQFRTPALWDAFYNATYKGGPQGIGLWYRYASSHGKQLAVPEWGVWNRSVGTEVADDPLYIQFMFDFFSDHASGIAYENYFNCNDDHRLYPDSPFPNASARYRALWSAGP